MLQLVHILTVFDENYTSFTHEAEHCAFLESTGIFTLTSGKLDLLLFSQPAPA